NARFIIDRLQQSGYTCYAVGGCVRDSILGREPADWDFTTSALPEEIERVFSDCRTLNFGKQFGTIGIILDNEQYEVTTYRLDGEYTDSRHPDSVSFSTSLQDDLSRRDFTINAMAYNDTDGLIDYFDGQKDLKFGVIRCVGVATNRFAEDALRILRALRFAATLGFSIEAATSAAILSGKRMLSAIAYERISDELLKLLCGEKADFVLRRYRSVFAVFIPELVGTFDYEQNSKHHNRDVYRHTVAAVSNIEPDPLLRTTMLFHDIGKPLSHTTDRHGESHYYNHPILGAAMAEEILRRLCMPRLFINDVSILIRYHDVRLKPDPVGIKKLLSKLGVETVRRLYKVQRADILAQSMYQREEKLRNLSAVEAETERILSAGECYNLKMLEINGSDLLHIGITSGEEIGKTLDTLLDKVITGELSNDKNTLIAAAKAI
ncbi:MAG: CCA tRNA nucleotidyltransferase, partial [Ruminococcus sp.]|nr:CCA tRNA nucleotidyltransferase [Ruminococcus sp.]